jgi:hypothetical protein
MTLPLATDESYVYWLEQTSVHRVPKSGGPAITVAENVRTHLFIPSAIATDAAGVSWTEVAGGRIRRAGAPVPAVLTLEVNESVFQPGDTLTVIAALRPGTTLSPVDAYVVERLSSGAYLSLQLDGRLVDGLVPIARGILPVPLRAEILRTTVAAGMPAGAYAWLSALTEPGTLNIIGQVHETHFVVAGDPPGPPTNLRATIEKGGVTVEWLAPHVGSAATSYRLEAGSESGLADLLPGFDTGSTATVISFAGVPAGRYYVRLRAVNALGASLASNEVVVVVP